jgi:cysteine desulfurase / selenocysteine lyase
MRFFSFLLLLAIPIFSYGDEEKVNYFDVNEVKKSFPIFKHHPSLVYLDSAATTQKPLSVIAKTNKFYSEDYGTVHRAGYKLAQEATKEYNAVRKKIQNFLHAQSEEEIIFTRGTTDGVNLVAYSFGKAFIQKDDEIIVSEMEHHSNLIPWQMLCAEKGAKLKVIPIDANGNLLLDEYDKLLSAKTKLVAVTHVANTIGTVNPVKEIAFRAHAKGAIVLIDGAQAVGHMPVDVQDIDADFYVFSGHKIYGPTGVGILYGKKDLLLKMPPAFGGGTMARVVTFESFEPKKPPLKFEAGTPMIAEVMALGDAVTFIEQIGRDKMEKQDRALIDYAKARMKLIPGVKLVGNPDHQASVIAFTVENIYPDELEKELDRHDIAIRTGTFCAQPIVNHFDLAGFARISLGVYTTYEDIDFFLSCLSNLVSSYYSRPRFLTDNGCNMEKSASLGADFEED